MLSRPNRLDEMTVRVESRADLGPQDRDHLAAGLRTRIKERIGVSCDVKIAAPNTLPRSAGKLTRVIDLRGS